MTSGDHDSGVHLDEDGYIGVGISYLVVGMINLVIAPKSVGPTNGVQGRLLLLAIFIE